MQSFRDPTILRQKAQEFRRAAGKALNLEIQAQLLHLAELYEMRAKLIEENDALRRELG